MKTPLLSFFCSLVFVAHVTSAPVKPQGSLIAIDTTCLSDGASLFFEFTAGVTPLTVVIKQSGTPENLDTFSGISNVTILNPVSAVPRITAATVFSLVSITGADGGVRTSGFANKSTHAHFYPTPGGHIDISDNTICQGGTAKLIFIGQTGEDYEWSTGATTRSITVSEQGEYFIGINNQYGCTASEVVAVYCSDAPLTDGKTDNNEDRANASADNLTNNLEASVYPNPSTGAFHLKVSGGNMDNVNIFVHDATGRLVEQRIGVAYTSDIILGDSYAAGVYIIQVQQDNTAKQLRVVKTE